MTKIKVKKISSEITFKEVSTTHTLNVNGKEIRVYEHSRHSDWHFDQPEYDLDVDEKDYQLLTEEEQEILGEDLNSHIDLKDGEEVELEGWEE